MVLADKVENEAALVFQVEDSGMRPTLVAPKGIRSTTSPGSRATRLERKSNNNESPPVPKAARLGRFLRASRNTDDGKKTKSSTVFSRKLQPKKSAKNGAAMKAQAEFRSKQEKKAKQQVSKTEGPNLNMPSPESLQPETSQPSRTPSIEFDFDVIYAQEKESLEGTPRKKNSLRQSLRSLGRRKSGNDTEESQPKERKYDDQFEMSMGDLV